MIDRPPQEGDLILDRTADDAVRVEVLYESETFWLDQRRDEFGVRQDREFESDFEAEVRRIESKRARKRKEEP